MAGSEQSPIEDLEDRVHNLELLVLAMVSQIDNPMAIEFLERSKSLGAFKIKELKGSNGAYSDMQINIPK